MKLFKMIKFNQFRLDVFPLILLVLVFPFLSAAQSDCTTPDPSPELFGAFVKQVPDIIAYGIANPNVTLVNIPIRVKRN